MNPLVYDVMVGPIGDDQWLVIGIFILIALMLGIIVAVIDVIIEGDIMIKIWTMIKTFFTAEFPEDGNQQAADAIVLMNCTNPTMSVITTSQIATKQEVDQLSV